MQVQITTFIPSCTSGTPPTLVIGTIGMSVVDSVGLFLEPALIMLKQQYILSIGLSLSIMFGSKFQLQDGTLNIKLTFYNLFGVVLTCCILFYSKCKVRQYQCPPTEHTQSQLQALQSLQEFQPIEQVDSISESQCTLSQSSPPTYTESPKPILRKPSYQDSELSLSLYESDDQNVRSSSLGELRSRKVSFDEKQNTIHLFKKNNRKEIRNYELSSQQLKTEKKKKNELIKQKRRDENFRKVNINDINKRMRKRKSSYDDQGSI